MALKKSKTVKESVLKDDVAFLTVEECADYLRIHYITLYKWIRENKGPPVKHFSRQSIRVPKKSFLEWAETRSK
jgi:excisionase family DNA binding protein